MNKMKKTNKMIKIDKTDLTTAFKSGVQTILSARRETRSPRGPSLRHVTAITAAEASINANMNKSTN